VVAPTKEDTPQLGLSALLIKAVLARCCSPGSRSRGQGQMKVKPINLLLGASDPYWHCDDARYQTKDIYLPLNVDNPNAAAYTRHSFRDHGIVPTKTI